MRCPRLSALPGFAHRVAKLYKLELCGSACSGLALFQDRWSCCGLNAQRHRFSYLFVYLHIVRLKVVHKAVNGEAQCVDQFDIDDDMRLPPPARNRPDALLRSEEHTSELQSRFDLVCRLLLEKKSRIPFPYSAVEHSISAERACVTGNCA